MSPERIPLGPPPRALHAIVCPEGSFRPGEPFTVLCGSRGRRLHGTLNQAMVTCPRCLALLTDQARPATS
jgi:hypothetical protein